MMDQNDQNDRFDRFDRFEPDFSRFESASDRSERSSSLDRSERPARTGRRQSARPVRSGMRMGKGKPMRRASVKLNYRMVLCIAVLVLLLLTIIFGGLFKSRGSKIADLNSQIETLNKDKDNLSAQIGALTQENQTLQSSITATLPAAKTAETNSIVDLIPMLNDGVYVVQSTGSQLRYISVPKGYLQDKLGEYRDDASGYAASTGDAPICQYYVLFTDRVIGLAEGDTGFVSTDRSATGSTSTIPSMTLLLRSSITAAIPRLPAAVRAIAAARIAALTVQATAVRPTIRLTAALPPYLRMQTHNLRKN